MTSLILRTATRYLLPILLLLSVYLLLRGHNEPGGGFVGGLVAASAHCLYILGFGVESAQRTWRIEPRTLISVGLLVAAVSGSFSLLLGAPFMTGIWSERAWPVIGKVGTPFLFDIGVYCVVIGVVLTIIYAVAED